MTNDIQHPETTEEKKSSPFGARLQSAREAKGLKRKDVAAQLRLNEKVILMMEKDRYPADLPATFIRGYLRSYAGLLQIPDHEIRKALEPIIIKSQLLQPSTPTAPLQTVTSGNYFMQFFTYLVVFTMIGLVGTWWYSHNTPAPSDSQIALTAINIKPATVPPLASPAPSATANAPQTIVAATSSPAATANPVLHPVVPMVPPTISHGDIQAPKMAQNATHLKTTPITIEQDDEDDDSPDAAPSSSAESNSNDSD